MEAKQATNSWPITQSASIWAAAVQLWNSKWHSNMASTCSFVLQAWRKAVQRSISVSWPVRAPCMHTPLWNLAARTHSMSRYPLARLASASLWSQLARHLGAHALHPSWLLGQQQHLWFAATVGGHEVKLECQVSRHCCECANAGWRCQICSSSTSTQENHVCNL